MSKHLVLMDIDGTLLRAGGIGRASVRLALEEVYGSSAGIDDYRFGGRTDRATVHRLLGVQGWASEAIEERFEDFHAALAHHLTQLIASGAFEIIACPGTLPLIDALHGVEGVVLGLVTGNTAGSAPLKLAAAGFDPLHFPIGAFGDESQERNDLPPLAVARAEQLSGARFHGSQVVVIGDTPDDIRCGRHIGARTISVLTGWYSAEQLNPHQPDLVLDDLQDTNAVLQAIFATDNAQEKRPS
ncbi:MAG: HAD hydrolase-like protein [Chloroflexi bacterium]|nr:HAD hydrolase-like protein [Chloroflexota bacterium]